MKRFTYNKIVLLPFAIAVIASCVCSCRSNTRDTTHKDPLDLSARDTTVNPADDFFDYANGTWLKNTEIPADQSGWGSYVTLSEKVSEQIKGILDSCSSLKNPVIGSPAQQIGNLYASAMDSVAIEKAALLPLKKSLGQIEAIQNVPDLLTVISTDKVEGYGADAPFDYGVETDAKNSNVERMGFYQGGLGLPNKTYYFKTDSAGKAILSAYHLFITKLLTLSEEDSAAAFTHAGAIIALETKMAAASKSPVELRDPQSNYHLMTVKDMDKIAPQFRWKTLLTSLQIKEDTLVVEQPEFYKALSELLTSTSIQVWKEYLKFHLISNYAEWLSSPFFNAQFAFIRSLFGVKAPWPRWERACRLIDYELGDALGKIYVQKYFPLSAKSYMENMVENLRAAFKEHIENLDWMSDSTKAKALDKLNFMVKKIGYPDKWKDYSSIHINRSSIIDNIRQADIWQYHYNINKLGKPVDRSEWHMTPPTVNAYYSDVSNDINFPAGYLQPPYYFQRGDDAVNYGSIGETIGHEMTHGFDDEGSQFDKDGNMKNWWTKEDREKFEKRAGQIVKQFDQYTILDTVHLNGKLIEGENIADLGGIAIAYTAFKKTKEGQSGTLIDGLTPDQRFFLSYAQEWRVKRRPEIQLFYAHSDTHSPEKYRVNGPLSNMPAFYKAFDVKPGDKMYRPDSARVKIW